MRRYLSLAAVIVAGAVAPGADAAFSDHVCGLLSGAQVATIPGVPAKCTPATPLKTLQVASYGGNWTGSNPTSPHLDITVAVYPSSRSAYFRTAVQNLGVGTTALPLKKVGGIGARAYESRSGRRITTIGFLVGRDICTINIQTARPLASLSAVNAIARAIAAQL
jgi:hypothetical protein